ncbi:MAG: DUF2953 domain-containing protein [Syntrophales bacterium]
MGTGDPASTGMLMAIMAACFSWIPAPLLCIEPDFEEERFCLEGRLSANILLFSMLLLAGEFLLSSEGREIINNFSGRRRIWST